jgi:ethanolamine utilization protein EutA (predicted chaperonin)
VADQKIGELLDALGVTIDLDEGDMPVDAHVLLKIVKADGTVSLVKAVSESLDWITLVGMLTAALHFENNGYINSHDDD